MVLGAFYGGVLDPGDFWGHVDEGAVDAEWFAV